VAQGQQPARPERHPGALAESGPGPEPGSESRRARKKARTRREIYQAAMRLFAESGFDGVTVEAICAAADVARATFFHHFPSKAALLLEFNRRLAAELDAKLGSASDDAAGDFLALCALLAERWLEQADVLGPMLRELLVQPDGVRRQAGEKDLADLIARLVRRGQAQGVFRTHLAPELAAVVFLSASTSLAAGALRSEPPLSAEAIRDQFAELMLHGLLASGGGD
jgi:AcrR family transcriptional regulator